jgi:pimeloyl-ACP methyl ester carboxylesterase
MDNLTTDAWVDRNAYPFQSRFLASADGRMHYVDEGPRRDPILFVHGTPSWSFEWRHAIERLRAERRCVAVDHLGFGLSDKPALAAYKPEDHARRLLDVVRALDLRDLTLVVHDFGGPIGLPVWLEAPERVRSVVLVNTWAWAHGDDRRVRRLSRLVASPLGRFLYLSLNASPRWLLPASFAHRARLTRDVHAQYLAPFVSRGERIAPWVLGCELTGSDAYYARLAERLADAAPVPTALLWGLRDPAFGPSYLQRWRELLPHATVFEAEDAGHFPQEEAPARLLEAIAATALGPPIGVIDAYSPVV